MTQKNFAIDYMYKMNFSDVIFFIPYRGSNKFRVEALMCQMKYLASIIDTPIVYILEAAESPTLTISSIYTLQTSSNMFTCFISHCLDDGFFHKTNYLNQLLRDTKTHWGDKFKYVCVLDYDVFLFPEAYNNAYKYLKRLWASGGRGMVIPHSAMVYLDDRLSEIVKEKDISYLLEFEATVNSQHPGGVQFFTMDALNDVNGWNEELYLGGEDYEIAHRIDVMGGVVSSLGSVAYHLYHPVVHWKNTIEYRNGLDVIGEVSCIVDMDKMTEYIITKMKGCYVDTRI